VALVVGFVLWVVGVGGSNQESVVSGEW